ncbi:thiol reductant ABC exporter subunit CydD [Millisia brevis]|uniref:thiol reductant ABC exporter subunit CydD n=1 Tax=Millisia brevis TaxID=264148 RepID=UPI00082B7529|nr:thiol reductant ABC exporter subunit CydD [Millisia brevis]
MTAAVESGARPARAGRGPIDPRLWRYSRGTRRYLVVTAIAALVSTAAILLTAYAIGDAVAGVLVDGLSAATLGPALAQIAAAVVLRAAAGWLHGRYAQRAAGRVIAELQTSVTAAAAGRPDRVARAERDHTVTVVTTGLTALSDYLTGYLPALVSCILVTPIVVVAIALVDPTSAAIVVVTLPLIPLFMVLIGLLTKGRSDRTLTALTALSARLSDLIAGLPTLRALGREEGPAPLIVEVGDRHRRTTMAGLRVAFLSGAVLEILATLSVALVAVTIGMRLVYGEMDLWPGVVALVLAPEAYQPLRAVGARFHAAQDGVAAADQAFGLLAEAPGNRAVAAHPVAASDPRGVDLAVDRLTVASRSGPAPDSLTATFAAGRWTVLTGPNGSGKSTTLMVLLGLTAPDEGLALADGSPIVGDPAWWSRVAWLPQRPVLVAGTLADNLGLYGVTPDDPDLPAICAATGFDEVLAGLPDRWQTTIGTGGVGLSLGQRQRLALTRTLAAPRGVLLLDEPTAHLDGETEARVLTTLRELADAGRTVIVVAHRQAVLAAADRVIEVRGAVVPQ